MGMDKLTWAAVVGVVVLSVAAIVSVVAPRPGQALDPNAPEGVATAYMNAIRDKRPDDAWAVLDSPDALEGTYGGSGRSSLTRDQFRQQVNNNYHRGDRRLRIVETKTTGDTARVDVEITTFSNGSLFGPSSYSHTVTFNLKQRDGAWRITSSPSLYELG
jgi:hypothetical protein